MEHDRSPLPVTPGRATVPMISPLGKLNNKINSSTLTYKHVFTTFSFNAVVKQRLLSVANDLRFNIASPILFDSS